MVSEPEEDDFEKMFEASQQARRIEKGRTIEGTIRGDRPGIRPGRCRRQERSRDRHRRVEG